MSTRGALAACAILVPEVAFANEEPASAIKFGATYVTDLIANVDGGRQRGSDWLGRADVTMSIDGSVFGWDGAEAFVDILAVHRSDFSGRFVGDAQAVSNVQGDSAVRPMEAWIAGPIGGGASVKIGMIDLNSEFDVQSVGKHFINSSHGIGPEFSQSGANGPSIFPAGATAVMLRYEDKQWAFRLGLFDAVAGSRDDPRRAAFRFPGATGALLVAEADRKLGDAARLQFGAWRYTPKFDRIDPAAPGQGISQGAYAMVEGPLAVLDDRRLDAWLRVGVASAHVNEIGTYVGGGLAFGNDDRRWGLAVAHARRGHAARRAVAAAGGHSDRAETAIEFTYCIRLTPWLAVQPDVQYVINPGWDPALRNATVGGLRFSFSVPTN